MLFHVYAIVNTKKIYHRSSCMLIAYLILAHTNPEQLGRLIRKLQTENTRVFVHLDAKAANRQLYCDAVQSAGNAAFVYPQTDVRWGAYSVVQAILNGLGVIAGSELDFDYIVLMSGQDYPIKNNRYIHEFFMRNRGCEFIHHRRLPIEEFRDGRMDRIWYYYNYDNTRNAFDTPGGCAYEAEMKQRGMKRSFIPGMVPYHGSMWWSLTGDCIRHILKTVRENREIVNFFRYTKFPDEQFFQTLVMNSPYAGKVSNENLWYTDWSGENTLHPKTLGASDFSALEGASALFARKFNANLDEQILNLIDGCL
jgi:hypothetical protein